MTKDPQDEEVWALVGLRLKGNDQPIICGWQVEGRPWRYGRIVTDPMGGHEPIRIDIRHVAFITDTGELVQPWLVRCYLEACVSALGTVGKLAGFTGQDLVNQAETVIDVLAAFGTIGTPWRPMACVHDPAPAVLLWRHWASVVHSGGLSLAEMIELLPGPSPTPGQGDDVPEGWASRLDACHQVFAELQAHLKADRIPAVVRRPADALGGLSVLEMIRTGRTSELAKDVRASFDYGAGT